MSHYRTWTGEGEVKLAAFQMGAAGMKGGNRRRNMTEENHESREGKSSPIGTVFFWGGVAAPERGLTDSAVSVSSPGEEEPKATMQDCTMYPFYLLILILQLQ